MVFILFVVVLYLYHRADIRDVVERTGLGDTITERISGDRPEPDPAAEDERPADEPEEAPEDQAPEIETIPEPGSPDGSDPDHPTTSERRRAEDAETEPQPDEAEEHDEPEVAEETPEQDEPDERERRYGIYFIRVTDEGQIYPERVERRVRFTDSPMTATLRELMRGPTLEELNSGYLNLIPDEAELISAWVRDGTAYLNFSESFQFNTMGVEGLVAQLKQVVYSTTEFPTVERVQILIEGERTRYLGAAGVYVEEPLQRESFG